MQGGLRVPFLLFVDLSLFSEQCGFATVTFRSHLSSYLYEGMFNFLNCFQWNFLIPTKE